MRPAEEKYVRVYYSICDDEKFATVYPDDRLLATWLRLLMLADSTYPASAPLPRSAAPKAIARLAELRIIDLRGDHFRVHGLDAERERRAEAGRVGASGRWSKTDATAMRPHSDRNATASGGALRAETSKDEQSKDEQNARVGKTAAADVEDPAVAFHHRTGQYPTGRLLAWINDLGAKYGDAATAALIQEMPLHLGEQPNAYLRRISDALALANRAAQRAEEQDEQRRLREKRAPVVSPAIAQLRAALVAREQDGTAA